MFVIVFVLFHVYGSALALTSVLARTRICKLVLVSAFVLVRVCAHARAY